MAISLCPKYKMKYFSKKLQLRINWIPTVGIISFLGLFIYSATLYPGGSQSNLNTIGYDWMNNYVCNLMSEKSINEEINPARTYAILGMVILCMSLIIFFYQFSKTFVTDKNWASIIFVAGILSMISASFIFTKYHDLMTTISSFFGLFVVVGIIKGVHKSSLTSYKLAGGLCLVLLLVNNIIYYTAYKIDYLPLVQKVTFAIVLIWIVSLNYQIMKRIKDWV